MSGTTSALLRRELGRLAAGRVFLFGGLFALLLLSTTAAYTIVSVVLQNSDPMEQAAEICAQGYSQTGAYDGVIFLLALFLGANQIGGDVRAGTIFSVLARPISRTRLFLAGFAASAAALVSLELLRSGPILGAAGWLQRGLGLPQVLGASAIVLGEILTLATFAALGSVMAPAYAALAGFAALLVPQMAFAGGVGGFGAKLVGILAWLLPLIYGQNDVIAKAIQGSEQTSGPILEIIAYRACWTALLVALGVWGFSRRDLAPKV